MGTDRRRNSGLTLIELLVVLAIGSVILVPLISLLVSTQKNAYKGFDRLESLSTARIILEKAIRDLRMLCFRDGVPAMRLNVTDKVEEISFAVFPPPGKIPEFRNPVNLVRYTFNKETKQLSRTLQVHDLLKGSLGAGYTEVLGQAVVHFSIRRRMMFEMPCYEVEVKSESNHPQRKETAVYLKSSTRSEFESRLIRHRYFISNRVSVPELPGDTR